MVQFPTILRFALLLIALLVPTTRAAVSETPNKNLRSGSVVLEQNSAARALNVDQAQDEEIVKLPVLTFVFEMATDTSFDEVAFRRAIEQYVLDSMEHRYASELITVKSAISYDSFTGQGMVIVTGTFSGLQVDAPSEIAFRESFGFWGIENLLQSLEEDGFPVVEQLQVKVNGRATGPLQSRDESHSGQEDNNDKMAYIFAAVLVLGCGLVISSVFFLAIRQRIIVEENAPTKQPGRTFILAQDPHAESKSNPMDAKRYYNHYNLNNTMDTILSEDEAEIIVDTDDQSDSDSSIDSELFPEQAAKKNAVFSLKEESTESHPAADPTLYTESKLSQVDAEPSSPWTTHSSMASTASPSRNAESTYYVNENGKRKVRPPITSFLCDPNDLVM